MLLCLIFLFCLLKTKQKLLQSVKCDGVFCKTDPGHMSELSNYLVNASFIYTAANGM